MIPRLIISLFFEHKRRDFYLFFQIIKKREAKNFDEILDGQRETLFLEHTFLSCSQCPSRRIIRGLRYLVDRVRFRFGFPGSVSALTPLR